MKDYQKGANLFSVVFEDAFSGNSLDPTKWSGLAPVSGSAVHLSDLLNIGSLQGVVPPLQMTWRQKVGQFGIGAGEVLVGLRSINGLASAAVYVYAGVAAAYLAQFAETGPTDTSTTPTWTEDNNYHVFRLVWRKGSISLYRDDLLLGEVPSLMSGSAGYQMGIFIATATASGATLDVDWIRMESESPPSMVDITGLKVNLDGSINVTGLPTTPHKLLDGVIDNDTNPYTVVRGAIITGQLVGATILWNGYLPSGAGFIYFNGTDVLGKTIATSDLPPNIPISLLAGGTDAYVIKMVSGTPTWAPESGGGGITYGSTLPPGPTTGQLFLMIPTGRIILMEYDGSNWNSLFAYGDTVFYVDSAGTDDYNHGYGPGANAFLTVQFAINAIPAVCAGNVTINLANYTFVEYDVIQGKQFTGAFNITFQGTMSTALGTTIASGGSLGGPGVLNTLTVAGTPWTAHAYQNMLCVFASNTLTPSLRGLQIMIDDNTVNTLTFVGYLPDAPALGDTFSITYAGTNIYKLAIINGQRNIIIRNVALGGGVNSPSLYVYNYASVKTQACWITPTTTYGFGIQVAFFSNIIMEHSLFAMTTGEPCQAAEQSIVEFDSCKIRVLYGTGVSSNIIDALQATLIRYVDSIVDGGLPKPPGAGIALTSTSILAILTLTSGGNHKNQMRNITTGLFGNFLSHCKGGASITDVNVSTHDSFDSSTYSAYGT
jgi:hypothetical protein